MAKVKVLIILILIVSFGSVGNASEVDNLVPSEYILSISYLENNLNYHGIVNITFKILKSTMNITMHSSGLHITEVTLADTSTELKFDTIDDLLIIHGEDTFSVDIKYTLNIEFNGSINDKDEIGFFKSTFLNSTEKYELKILDLEH